WHYPCAPKYKKNENAPEFSCNSHPALIAWGHAVSARSVRHERIRPADEESVGGNRSGVIRNPFVVPAAPKPRGRYHLSSGYGCLACKGGWPGAGLVLAFSQGIRARSPVRGPGFTLSIVTVQEEVFMPRVVRRSA